MNQSHDTELLARIARSVTWFGERVYGNAAWESASPLYAQFCADMIGDTAILTLMADADQHQQITHLLFGSVHYLLLNGEQHPLTDFYADLCAEPRPKAEAYPYFRAFCLEHADEIHRLVTTKRVQTNEVWRCTGLLPAFGLVAQHGQGKPLALLEIGPSAGLILLWDQYGYDYGAAGYVGTKSSPVQLSCKLRGNLQPPLPHALPPIAWRAGIDLLPIDVGNEEETRWLQALIWPEQKVRAALLQRAIKLAQQHPPRLIAGNALDLLPTLLAKMPQESTLCVYHSYALNQAPKDVRDGIFVLLAEYSRVRDFFRVSLEWYTGQTDATLELFAYQQGNVKGELLAHCEGHGRWIEWLQKE